MLFQDPCLEKQEYTFPPQFLFYTESLKKKEREKSAKASQTLLEQTVLLRMGGCRTSNEVLKLYSVWVGKCHDLCKELRVKQEVENKSKYVTYIRCSLSSNTGLCNCKSLLFYNFQFWLHKN